MPKYAYKSTEWHKEYFPEYYDLFQGKSGVPVYSSYPPAPPPPNTPTVSQSRTVAEKAPWGYWSSFIDPAGIIYVTDYSQEYVGYPWVVAVTEEAYVMWANKANYFRNGGRTPHGAKGLDPRLLVGAYALSYEDDIVHTPGGILAKNPNGKPDTFTDQNGEVIYTSDRGQPTTISPAPLQFDSDIAIWLTGGASVK